MKKFNAALAVVLALCFLLFTACGGSNDATESAESSAASEETSAAEPSGSAAEESAVSSEASKEESAAASADEQSSEAGDTSEEKVIPTNDYQPLNYEYMKAMWLYQYKTEGLFKTNGEQRDEADYREKVETICANLERDGFNTLFLQIGGHGDSFYPSKLYPPTMFVVPSYEDSFVYDPLEIFVEIAHKHKISLHAWINPYRLLTETQIQQVPEQYMIGKWYRENNGTYIVKVGDRYYGNPAYPEVRQLVIDRAVEICSNYDVDGLHLDDYFYPDGADGNFDFEIFAEEGGGRTLKQFRFDSVNTLVKGLFDAVHAVNKDLLFGISPSGNISNNRGYLCADVDTWCSTPGYVDYIAPQAYWSFHHQLDYAKYDQCCRNWAELTTCDSVRLIIGMGLYRAADATKPSSSDPDWFEYKDNIKRMLEFTYDFEPASGYIMFDYESLYNVFTGEYNPRTAEERENFLPLVKG